MSLKDMENVVYYLVLLACAIALIAVIAWLVKLICDIANKEEYLCDSCIHQTEKWKETDWRGDVRTLWTCDVKGDYTIKHKTLKCQNYEKAEK